MVQKKTEKDISNQTLAALLSVAIIVSLLGTIFIAQKTQKIVYVTGATTESNTGTLSVNIESVTGINFTHGALNWSIGQVAAGAANCTLTTNDTTLHATCKNFSVVSWGFQIENTGNQNVTLNISSGKTGPTLFGGSANLDSYMWAFGVNQTNSCLNITGAAAGVQLRNTSWSSVSTSSIKACDWFQTLDSADAIKLDVKLVIPSDAQTGSQSDTITAVAETI